MIFLTVIRCKEDGGMRDRNDVPPNAIGKRAIVTPSGSFNR